MVKTYPTRTQTTQAKPGRLIDSRDLRKSLTNRLLMAKLTRQKLQRIYITKNTVYRIPSEKSLNKQIPKQTITTIIPGEGGRNPIS